MKVLLDENLPEAFRHELPNHDVYTVAFKKWKGIKNGKLLALAADEKFDVLLTIDKAMTNEHNLKTLPIAILVVDAKSNAFQELLLFVPSILVSLNHLKANAVNFVSRST